MADITPEGVLKEVKDAIQEKASEWKTHYEELKQQGCDTGKRLEDVKKVADNAVKRLEEAEAMLNRPGFVRMADRQIKSIGQCVIEDEYFQSKIKGAGSHWRGTLGIPVQNLDVPGEKHAGTFFPELFAPIWAMAPEVKTTITSTAVGSSTPGILIPQRIPGIVKPGIPRLRVRELIPRLPTTSNAIEFVKENVFTNNASPQVEGSAKQESALTFTIDSETVKTVAHWIPATRQVLDDFVGLQAYVDMRLIEGLKDEEDDQILRGDGTGQNLSGLSNEATAYTDGTYDQTGDTDLDKLVRMLTQLEDANLVGTGYILHPRNWRVMQTTKSDGGGGAGTGPYVLGGPQGTTPPMAWGLPVATTTRMTAGNAFVGAFATHVILWDRMTARVDVSTEHAEYFTQNMVAIRAEERLALTVLRSDAVIYESSL